MSWLKRSTRSCASALPSGPPLFSRWRTAKRCSASKVKRPSKRIGNAKTPIENREPRLRHNRAIEFFGGARLGAPAHQAVERVQVRGHFSVRWHYLAACVCTGFIEGQVAVHRDEPIAYGRNGLLVPALRQRSLPPLLAGCGAQIDRHGHVFMDVDLHQVQPGMSKDQVQTVLGSPDTTSTIGGDAYYYISTTQKTVRVLQAQGDRPQGGRGLFRSAGQPCSTSPITG